MILLFTSLISHSSLSNSFLLKPNKISLTATPDIYEDDNDFSTAKEITINTIQNRSISSIDDEDYVKFVLDTYATIEIETNGTFGDTRMWLFTYIETLLYFDDDGGSNQFSLISADLLSVGLAVMERSEPE